MRAFIIMAAMLVIVTGAGAQTAPAASKALEIVRDDVDLEASADGKFATSRYVISRPLTEAGVEALHQARLSYAPGFQTLWIVQAYTLKKNGTRLDVPKENILYGRGQSASEGYDDIRTIQIVFSDLEVGDQVGLETLTTQTRPWFAGVFNFSQGFPRQLAMHEATIAVTTPVAMNPRIEGSGLDKDAVQVLNGKMRQTWHYRNDTALTYEADAALEQEDEPYLEVGTLSDYAAVARLYRDIFHDKPLVTPEIQSLADGLVKGVSDPRAKAALLYDWVSAHIKYVNIVLGAGGFVPQTAGVVLKNGFGDCKDHVMILQALLSAEGIPSSAVLINAGTSQYRLPKVPTPFAFNHLIAYVPQFDMFMDSTAQYAPFGVLPYADAGRTVVIVETGATPVTPRMKNADMRADTSLTVNKDGSADGDSKITATGPAAIELRGLLAASPPDRDQDFLRAFLGPGATGSVARGDVTVLADPYVFSVHYHLANFANIPGAGAFPAQLGFKPFSFTSMIAGALPASRNSNYFCKTIRAQANVVLTLPPNVAVPQLPATRNFTAPGVDLQTRFDRDGTARIRESDKLEMTYPSDVCTPDYYAAVHDRLAAMQRALSAQIIYREGKKH